MNNSYIEKIRLERESAEKVASENISDWIYRGHQLFTKDKWEQWDKIVPIRAKDIYNGLELEYTLQIQAILISNYSEECFEKARICMYNQNHSGTSWLLVCNMIKEFCTHGEEFILWIEANECFRKDV